MLKYVSKFFLEILPSVVATVVGAYIVNHYIAPKPWPGAEAPKVTAVSHVDSPQAQPPKATADLAPAREAAPVRDAKARGVDKAQDKAAAKAQAERILADRPADSAKADPEPRRFVIREKAVEKAPPTAQAPADTALIVAPAIAASPAPEDHPDAAELARAALNRLRTADPTGRPAEANAAPAVVHEAPREPVRETSRVTAVSNASTIAEPPPPAVPPLPPPVSVAPPVERASVANAPAADNPPMSRTSEADRLVPPADIPASSSESADLQVAASPPKKKSVADDMLSAARSVFQSVVPQ